MKLHKPILIDELTYEIAMLVRAGKNTIRGENSYWYVTKPIPFYGIETLLRRFYHGWLVLIGKAQAFQYHEDRD